MKECKCPTTVDEQGRTHHWHKANCSTAKALKAAGMIEKPICKCCRKKMLKEL